MTISGTTKLIQVGISIATLAAVLSLIQKKKAKVAKKRIESLFKKSNNKFFK